MLSPCESPMSVIQKYCTIMTTCTYVMLLYDVCIHVYALQTFLESVWWRLQ